MTITVSTTDPRSLKALAVLETAPRWLKVRRKGHGAARKTVWMGLAAAPEPSYTGDAEVEFRLGLTGRTAGSWLDGIKRHIAVEYPDLGARCVTTCW